MMQLNPPTPEVIRTLTVRTILDRALRVRPESEALVARSGRLTYAELDAETNRAANALLGLGVGPGDRVAVSLPNDLTLAVTLLATARIGAVWVGINQQLAVPEKAYIVADAGAEVLIADLETSTAFRGAHVETRTLRHIIGADKDPSAVNWDQLLAEAADDRPDAEVDPTQIAAIGYTSGTTGFPKGVAHCHRALVLQGAVFSATRGMNSASRYGMWMPMCNIQSLMMSLITMAQVAGATVVIDHSDPPNTAQWIDRESVTHMPSVAATLMDLASSEAVDGSMLRSLIDLTCGGGDVPQTVVEEFHARSGVWPAVGYGQTEAAGAISMTPAGEAPVPGAVGRPLPHLEVAVVGEHGEVADDEIGELRVRAVADGPWADLFMPMLGYWHRPTETAAVLRDGWLYTGDLCSLNSDGHLFVRGRKAQMILRGGANVYPAEVERVLLDEPSVDAAAVLGVPDDRLGERVVAVVSPRPGHTVTSVSCMERCRAHLARYKRPDRIVIVDELPRNPTGKVNRADALRLFHEATTNAD